MCGSVELHPLPLEKITAPTLIISTPNDLFNILPAAEYAASSFSIACGERMIVSGFLSRTKLAGAFLRAKTKSLCR